jgi:hypothetical protein
MGSLLAGRVVNCVALPGVGVRVRMKLSGRASLRALLTAVASGGGVAGGSCVLVVMTTGGGDQGAGVRAGADLLVGPKVLTEEEGVDVEPVPAVLVPGSL